MRIVVLGAGTIGTSIAGMLCEHRHSVTVVDHDPANTRLVNDELDVRVVTGSAAQSSVLFQAGVLDAELCLAVTGSDEKEIMQPFGVEFDLERGVMLNPTRTLRRHTSDMRGHYADSAALERLIAGGDPLHYEVFEVPVPELYGQLMYCITRGKCTLFQMAF